MKFCQGSVDIEYSTGDEETVRCSNQVSEGHTLCTEVDSESHSAKIWWGD